MKRKNENRLRRAYRVCAHKRLLHLHRRGGSRHGAGTENAGRIEQFVPRFCREAACFPSPTGRLSAVRSSHRFAVGRIFLIEEIVVRVFLHMEFAHPCVEQFTQFVDVLLLARRNENHVRHCAGARMARFGGACGACHPRCMSSVNGMFSFPAGVRSFGSLGVKV